MDECDDIVDDALFYPSDVEDDIGLDGGLEEEDWDPINAIEGGCFFLDDFESLSDLEEDEESAIIELGDMDFMMKVKTMVMS